MKKMNWQDLLQLTQGKEFEIERIKVKSTGLSLEGRFSPPPLSQLSEEDLDFLLCFVELEGSIKSLEKHFGQSYPTIKNRVHQLVEVVSAEAKALRASRGENRPSQREVLNRLAEQSITIEEAEILLERLR